MQDSWTSSNSRDTKISENLFLQNQRELSRSQTSLTDPTVIDISSSGRGASSSSFSAFVSKNYPPGYKVLSFNQLRKLDLGSAYEHFHQNTRSRNLFQYQGPQ